MQPIITVQNISKRYQLGYYKPYDTLRDTVADWFTKTKTRAAHKNDFWALKNVSLDVNQGEIVGIIGRNGAGKSTLLKILSRITMPTSGEARIRGKIASLLEVGTGFNGELTGRENIFLNGAILGMNRREIKRKFDEIVSFAEVDKFIETPVKYYSSGMYARLAFAVAAHLDPEILIVDEVLSVGDLRFQKKSLSKMQSLTKAQGKTVLFVSHNLGSIKQLCGRTVLLDQGEVKFAGDTEEAIRQYIQESSNKNHHYPLQGTMADKVRIVEIIINKSKGGNIAVLPGDNVQIDLIFRSKVKVKSLIMNLALYIDGIRLFTLSDAKIPMDVHDGNFISRFNLQGYSLRPGYYSIAVGGYQAGTTEWLWGTDLSGFTIAEVWDKNNKQVDVGIINPPIYGQRILVK